MRKFICLILIIVFTWLVSGCKPVTTVVEPNGNLFSTSTMPNPTETVEQTDLPESNITPQLPTPTSTLGNADGEILTAQSDAYVPLDPEDWQIWPIIPQISPQAVTIYEEGIRQGRDPHAFSVFGDCQSLPETYMGIYDEGEVSFYENAENLRETIQWFSGSFSRISPTVKKGTTVAAILWEGWTESESSECEYGETPLVCEVRLHNPSIVFINLGTHWEVRNEMYLRKIVEELIKFGIVPIISTKADTREGEAHINQEMVMVASDYGVPVMNFWLAAQALESHGMIPNDTTYLNEEGLETHRVTSLQTLDTVWRELNSSQ